MHLSYSNVIKSNYVCENGNKAIDINIPIEINGEEEVEKLDGSFLEEYESIKRKGEEILRDANEKAALILKEAEESKEKVLYDAKETGFKQGYDEGNEIGYREGSEKGYKEATEKGEEIIQNANYILFQAKEEYDKYLEQKQMELRNIIVSSVETMLKKEFESESALDKLLESIIEDEKQNKMFVVRVAPQYEAHLSEVIEDIKKNSAIKGEVILLQDRDLEAGNLIVEKDNGKISFIPENCIDKLKEVLMEE